MKSGAQPYYTTGPTGALFKLCTQRRDAGTAARREAEALIAAGADIHAADADGNTPLHIAATNRNFAACTALIDAGAELEVRNTIDELTPLYEAYERNDDHDSTEAHDLYRLLMRAGASPNPPEGRFSTAFLWFHEARLGMVDNARDHFHPEVRIHNKEEPALSHYFTEEDGRRVLRKEVLDACATGCFHDFIAAPLLDPGDKTNWALFEEIYAALPKPWKQAYRGDLAACRKLQSKDGETLLDDAAAGGPHAARARRRREPTERGMS